MTLLTTVDMKHVCNVAFVSVISNVSIHMTRPVLCVMVLSL
jgi:hypothetical protein